MIELLLMPIVIAVLGSLLATRITTRAIRQRFNVSESAANTYTQEEIRFPVAILSGGRVQAPEMMDITYHLEIPDAEDGQFNRVTAIFFRDSQTAGASWDDEQVIFRLDNDADNAAINGFIHNEGPRQVELGPLGDPTEGWILLERSIFLGIVGTGNSGVKKISGYFNYHIVVLTAEEIAVQLFADDA